MPNKFLFSLFHSDQPFLCAITAILKHVNMLSARVKNSIVRNSILTSKASVYRTYLFYFYFNNLSAYNEVTIGSSECSSRPYALCKYRMQNTEYRMQIKYRIQNATTYVKLKKIQLLIYNCRIRQGPAHA